MEDQNQPAESPRAATQDPFPPHEPSAEEPYLVPIVFGDWSNDGHRDTERMYVWSNKGIAAWRRAFAEGCARTGVDLAESIAANYEDRSIAPDDLARLRASGFSYDLEEEGEVNIDEFAEMFFHLVRVGDPEITFTRMEFSTHHMEVHPGGYGILGNG